MLLSHHTQNVGGRPGVQGQPELQLKPREEEGGKEKWRERMEGGRRGGQRGGRQKKGRESRFDEMRELDYNYETGYIKLFSTFSSNFLKPYHTDQVHEK